ncbi:hypothetical protein JCM3766R1_004361 [Sporobolomyces carnicolor]
MSTEQKPDVKPDTSRHTLLIKMNDGTELQIKIKSDTPMKKVYAAVAKNKGLDATGFKITHDGTLIQPDDTPASLDFEDEEQLDVQMPQIGGGLGRARNQ